jgi:DNA-directed RNA polymerase subunit F
MEFRAIVESIIDKQPDRPYDGKVIYAYESVSIDTDILYAMLDEIDSLRSQVEYLKETMRDQAFERDYRKD